MRKQTMVRAVKHTRYIQLFEHVSVCFWVGAARAVMDGPSPYRKILRLRIFSLYFSLVFTGTCVKHHCMAQKPVL